MEIVWLLLAAAGGYGLRWLRPGRRLAAWAEHTLVSAGARHRARYWGAMAVTLVDIAVHPVRSHRNWSANRNREVVTEFSGAMKPAPRYDPDWAADRSEHQP
jgi:hypothetical protein